MHGHLADVFAYLETLAQPAIEAKDAARKQELEKYRDIYEEEKEKGVTCAYEDFPELCEILEAWPIEKGKGMYDEATRKRILDDKRDTAAREDSEG